ncbi:hypothetical protein AAY473_001349 [Plecturocebus cupreus]
MAGAGNHPPGTRPRGVWLGRQAAQPAHARRAGGHAHITAVLSRSTVTRVLRPSFSRRSRDHGGSSRETDQDQDRRGEAVRSRERRSAPPLRRLMAAREAERSAGPRRALNSRPHRGLRSQLDPAGRADSRARGPGTPLAVPLRSLAAGICGGSWWRPSLLAPAVVRWWAAAWGGGRAGQALIRCLLCARTGVPLLNLTR